MTHPANQPIGIESDATAPASPDAGPGEARTLTLPQHTRLTAVELVDRTDRHNELVHERQYLLHPSEPLDLPGNLFVAESLLDDRGYLLIKEAPLPHARAKRSTHDLEVRPRDSGYEARLLEDDGYPWHVLEYLGGELGRATALQNWQRAQRSALPVWFITNTWGDRNRDSRINEAFILKEIEAAARLGADMLQIDDGWQRGRTSNSAEAQATGGGAWEGFYAADPEFWTPDPNRFPNGLEPVLDAAKQAGLKIGLWFAPDSSDDFVNHQRDADVILGLHERYGIDCFKLDSIDMRSERGEQRVWQFIERVNVGSGGKVVLDLDVTAGTRPGYFGLMNAGPVFVENRYTDWHTYWPHATLRVLWRLSRWVDPRRLRMEFLNPTRHAEKYADDPLAPGRDDPAYLFATVMAGQPLGWFECSNLPRKMVEAVGELATVWREHRDAFFDGTILPIGDAPDGTAWTGFLSVSSDRRTGYALVLREMNERSKALITLPQSLFVRSSVVLHGTRSANISSHGDSLTVTLPASRSYVFARLSLDQA